jgi:thiamine-phosphate pyrophosphorylase
VSRPGPAGAGLERLRGIYAIADGDPRWPQGARAQVEGALAGGACAVQLRLKRARDADALELARWAAARCRAAGALSFVNDRFDLADLAGCDGVHLGQDDVVPEELPSDVRARLLVGWSTHTLEQVHDSRTRPIDYVAFGPVFGTQSKDSPFAPRGIAALREAVAAAAHPLVAIGGIGPEQVTAVAAAGARAAAVISAIAAATDPAAATRYLRERFRGGE